MKEPLVDFSYVKTHTFAGRRYKMIWRAPRKGLPAEFCYRGSCDSPQTKDATINISQRQSAEDILATVIHECAGHACFPTANEFAVQQMEDDVMRLLKRMGCNVSFTSKKP